MKNSFLLKLFIVFFFLTQFLALAQNNKIKIYESKSGDGRCLIVFPSSPEPLMVMTGNGECSIAKTMAYDDWNEMSSSTVVTTSVSEPAAATEHSIKSPRDAASGIATGKRQHKPYLLSDLSLDVVESESVKVCSFSWGMSNNAGSGSAGKATYDVKSNTKARALSPSGSCCSNGVCTVTVSVDKKHTKTGHVTLMK